MASSARTMDPPFAGGFVLRVDGVEIGAFTEVSGLAVTLDVEEITEGGNNETTVKVPGRLKCPNLVFKRGITSDNNLLAWMITSAGDGYDGHGQTLTRRTGSVALLDSSHTEVREWKFREAMPVRWTGPALAAGSSALATEELEVCHGGFTV
jgi:phage tail-like protein